MVLIAICGEVFRVVDKTQALYGDVEKPLTTAKNLQSHRLRAAPTPTAVLGRFQPLLGAEAVRPYDFSVGVAE